MSVESHKVGSDENGRSLPDLVTREQRMNPERLWYALRVRSGSEVTALASLKYYGFEAYFPQRQSRRRYSDRVKAVTAAVFPGYVFCKFKLADKSRVLASNAVGSIVSIGGQPAPIPYAEIEGMRRAVEAGGTATATPSVGDRVRVLDGCLAGIEGILVREARKTDFIVTVQLIRRSVSLSINQLFVERISNPLTHLESVDVRPSSQDQNNKLSLVGK